MTTFATNVVTPANAIVTALATAVASAQTLSINIGPNLPGTTLSGLASKSGWQSNVGDLRVNLASALNDLSVANQKFVAIAAMLGSIGSMD